jgi:hypothetical protein
MVMKIRKIDTKREKSLNIRSVKKVSLTSEVLFDKKTLVVESDKLNTAYTIFSLQKLTVKYGLDYDWLLVLIYLKELNLFEFTVMVIDRKIKLDYLLIAEYIVEDYSNNNTKLFKLTDKSISIVKEFYNSLSNTSLFISKNRKTELDVESKVKSVLGNYFNS